MVTAPQGSAPLRSPRGDWVLEPSLLLCCGFRPCLCQSAWEVEEQTISVALGEVDGGLVAAQFRSLKQPQGGLRLALPWLMGLLLLTSAASRGSG